MPTKDTPIHSAIADALVESGARTVFGVVGEGNIRVLADLLTSHEVQYVKAAREDGAVMMACGYASVTGEVGIATVTHGPGLTNAVTALVHGVRSSTPLVLLVGDTDQTVRHGRQSIDQAAVVNATGAGFEPVTAGIPAIEAVARAFGRARSERRPIVLNVPVDVQNLSADHAVPKLKVAARQAISPDLAALDQAAGLIAAARRPVIVAGWGAVLADAKQAIIGLAKQINAPLATSLRAKDFFRDEPYNLGIFGSLSHGIALESILAADCLIVFGASLNSDTTAENSLTAGKQIVQIDLDLSALGRQADVAVMVQADAKRAAVLLGEWLAQLGDSSSRGLCTSALQTKLSQFDPSTELAAHQGEGVDGRQLTLLLNRIFPCDRTYVSDSGRFMLPGYAWLQVADPRAFIGTADFGSIGLGLATAIGAAVGAPHRPLLFATGDGGLTMELAELLTAVRYGLDIVTVVYNDSAYGAELAITDRLGKAPDLAKLANTDFAAIAASMGAQSLRVDNAADLALIEGAIKHRQGPLLIDVKTDSRVPVNH